MLPVEDIVLMPFVRFLVAGTPGDDKVVGCPRDGVVGSEPFLTMPRGRRGREELLRAGDDVDTRTGLEGRLGCTVGGGLVGVSG